MKVRYKNLEAELIRNGISTSDLAKTLGRTYSSIRRKLTGCTSIRLDEAILIRNTYFPDKTIDYLFEVG